MMKNIARLLLSLIAASALACAVTIAQPSGLIILKGQTKEYINEIIQTPFVTVEGGGTLILRGSTLLVDGASEGAGNIWVKPGGTMLILNSSNITSANAFSYTFWVNETSTFEMRDSAISKCGRAALSTDYQKLGMLIKADDAVIENNVFGENYYCVIVSGAKNIQISKNAFEKCYRALTINGSDSGKVADNEFAANTNEYQYSINLGASLSSIVSGNTIRNQRGISLETTNGTSISNNSFLYEGPYDSINIGGMGTDSVQNILEDNEIYGKLWILGKNNVVKGGFVKTELVINSAADNNVFEDVQFTGTGMTLNSQSAAGNTFDNNDFTDTNFTEDNAVLRLGSGNTVTLAHFGRNMTISILGKNNRIEGVTLDDANGIIIEAGGNDAASLKLAPNVLNKVNVRKTPPANLASPVARGSLLAPTRAVVVHAAYTQIKDSTIEAENATALLVENADGVTVTDTVLKGSQPLYIKNSDNVVVSAPSLKAAGRKAVDSTEPFVVNWTLRGNEGVDPEESPYCGGGLAGWREASFIAGSPSPSFGPTGTPTPTLQPTGVPTTY